MNTAEAKVLHGLYFHREMIDEEMGYSAAELKWLAEASFEDGRKWQGQDGKLRALDSKNENYLASLGATSADAQRPVRYLEAAGYITYSSTGGFRISVTAKGADMARELDSRLGRLNILYRKNKDGVIWFIATILVSIITTLVTKCAG
jgi:hypothetical protein